MADGSAIRIGKPSPACSPAPGGPTRLTLVAPIEEPDESTLDEPIALINSKEKPLALYIYSRSNANIERIMQNTRAGGTCINHNGVHFFNNHLPFGGVNNSGIGKGHGFAGFEAFSNGRGVFRQVTPFGALDLLTAPYNAFKQKLIDISIKLF